MFVRDAFDRNLDVISSAASEFDVRAFDLVEKADGEGWLETLYQKLCAENPKNQRVLQLQEEVRDTNSLTLARVVNSDAIQGREVVSQDVANAAVVSEALTTGLQEPENSAHLVITVFWKGEKNLKQFRVVPKLCYVDSQTSEIKHKPLAEEEDIDAKPVPQGHFPEFLKALHTFALGKLRQSVADRPWTLSVALFLPLDLLCLPLSTWCGKDDTLIGRHAVVLGCSDRFNADCPDEALKLYNQLDLQWQRFLATVPDAVGASLQNLNWLDSNQAATNSLSNCQGFRCLGDWLVPGEWDKLDANVQQNWKNLIGFGVPLALWICQGQLAVTDRQQVFDSLAQGTRFNLLDRIPVERDILHRSGHCVGVLYEDLTYAPKRPKLPEQQLFSWPGF